MCYADYKNNENHIPFYKFRTIFYKNTLIIGLYKDEQYTRMPEQLIILNQLCLEECKSAQQQCNVTAGAICVFTTQENVKDTDKVPYSVFYTGRGQFVPG